MCWIAYVPRSYPLRLTLRGQIILLDFAMGTSVVQVVTTELGEAPARALGVLDEDVQSVVYAVIYGSPLRVIL